MDQNRFFLLFHKQLTGQLSPEEKQEWQVFANSHPKEKAALEALWKATGDTSGAYQPDVEAGLSRLKARMASEPVSRAPRAARIWRLALAASFLLVFGLVLWQLLAPPAVSWQVVHSGEEIRKVSLPDGSEVWLNAGSELTYPLAFAKAERKVQLKGEAFFQVVRDPSSPFSVATPSARVQVLGTSFNVRAFEKDTFEEVYVTTGKVAFQVDANKEKAILEANGKARWMKRDKTFLVSVDASENPLAWKNEKLSFFNTPFREVFRILEEQYRASIDVKQASHMLDCPYTNNFFNADLQEVLKGIARIYQFELEVVGSHAYRLSGGTCN